MMTPDERAKFEAEFDSLNTELKETLERFADFVNSGSTNGGSPGSLQSTMTAIHELFAAHEKPYEMPLEPPRVNRSIRG